MQLTRFGVELRAEVKGRLLTGHAAVFEQHAELPGHLEQISRSAFDSALDDATTDVRALFNHDPSFLLGRQSSGTLRLSTDSEGLVFEVDLPNTSAGRDVQELAERGDLTGASFGFIPGTDEWSEAPDGRKLRTHTSVSRLVDVSPVTFPAYEGAGVALRSISFGPRVPLPGTGTTRSRLITIRHRITTQENTK